MKSHASAIRWLTRLLVLLAVSIHLSAAGTVRRVNAKPAKSSRTVVQLKAPPVAVLTPVAEVDVKRGCLTSEQIPQLAQKLGMEETSLLQYTHQSAGFEQAQGLTPCPHFAMALDLSKRRNTLALLGTPSGPGGFEALILSKNPQTGAFVTRQVALDLPTDLRRMLIFNAQDFNSAPGSAEVPEPLRWELSLLVRQMLGGLPDATQGLVQVVFQREPDRLQERIVTIDLIESSTNRLVDSAQWLQRADGPGTYFSLHGIDYERKLWTSPVDYSRISRGIGESTTNLKRRVALKLGPNKKKILVLRNFTLKGTHVGIDFVAHQGTVVHSVADGEVAYAGYQGSFGNLIILDHGDGYQTYYAHLSGFVPGLGGKQRVRRGEEIGFVGTTGLSTGPHLHFEIRKDGNYVDPFVMENRLGFWNLQPEDHLNLVTQMLMQDLTRSSGH